LKIRNELKKKRRKEKMLKKLKKKRKSKKKVCEFQRNSKLKNVQLLAKKKQKFIPLKKCLSAQSVNLGGLNSKLKESYQINDLIIQQLCMMGKCLYMGARTLKKESTVIYKCSILRTLFSTKEEILKIMKLMKLNEINDSVGKR